MIQNNTAPKPQPDNANKPQPKRRRVIGLLAALVVLFGVLLALDLHFRGLAWRIFWSQTGEEAPIGQLRGMLELGGNLLRPQPNTAPMQPIRHNDASPYGINVFLQSEPDADKIRAMLRMIQAAGFVWLRQEFPWEDLEVDGRGQFTDTRNDYDGDGMPDTISAWDKYDRIVAITQQFGLKLQVRLSNPPAWTRSDPNSGDFAPPDDLQDFVNYAVAVAERYKGRITHYQIWNEPNIYPEWGNDFADPAAYSEMLCRTYDALKAVDPNIVVISAAIAPTIALDGYFGYQDLIYLQNMYDNGAGACFDILSAQGYGLFSGPTDRRMRLTTTNYARHIYYRDLMVANGDADKPIWISEAAWNPVLDAERPSDQIADFARYGTNTLDQAARWMPLAYERAQREWPWIGNISYWFFTRSDRSEANQSYFYFRMVEPDYSLDKPTFTPLPVYDSMKQYIAGQPPTLYRGTYHFRDWGVTLADEAEIIQRDDATFGEAVQAKTVRFSAYGTSIAVRTWDATSESWQEDVLYAGLLPTMQAYVIEDAAIMDVIIVRDDTWRNLALIAVSAALLLLGAGGVLLWRRRKVRSS